MPGRAHGTPICRAARPGWRVLVAWLLAMSCQESPTLPRTADSDAGAGTWKTWVLTSGAELRPAAPAAAGSSDERREIEDILRVQHARTAATDSMVRRWNGSPTARWDSVTLHVLDFYFPLLPDVRTATPVRAARVMALLHLAMYDALVATWDAKYEFRRAAPADADPRVAMLAWVSSVPSYPSEHAAAGAAAAEVLSYLFPGEDTAGYHAMAREAGQARIVAGAAYPSDVEAGSAIGRAVAARVIDGARADGSAELWQGTSPSGAGIWKPTPSKFVRIPFDASAGQWRTWVIPSGAAFRPPPPPPLGSPVFAQNIAELRSLATTRTAKQTDVARYWATDAPSVIWEKYMLEEIAQRDFGPVRAARAQALASVAMYDAFIACWDGKYHYWLERPVSADSTLQPVFPTPPFPSYPSGHSTVSAAAAEVFAMLFPDAAAAYLARSSDASVSRVYAVVHYRFDVEAGEALGTRVGRSVVERAAGDGAPH